MHFLIFKLMKIATKSAVLFDFLNNAVKNSKFCLLIGNF